MLPTYAELIQLMRSCEGRGETWLEFCEARGWYQCYCREYVRALADVLHDLYPQCIVEVAAGDGRLMRALATYGLPIYATDPNANDQDVERLTTSEALERYQPDTVIVSFPPLGAGIERAIISSTSVRTWIAIAPVLNQQLALDIPIPLPRWAVRFLHDVDRYSICRHDFLDSMGRVVKHSRTLLWQREH